VPKSSATAAEVLKDYGYSTATFGKWHNTPAEETTASGPFENWPTGYGFEYFYGFLAGEASQYEPNLVRNTTVVPPPKTPGEGYHLSEDLADDAIDWLRKHKAFQPDKPFYMYWASGCLHGPHHIMKEWADNYVGKFDDGWDEYRKRVFDRAKEKGWIPPETQLTPRPESLASWDSIPEEEKPFQRRLMEVAAGFAEHVDVQVGRLVDEVERLGYGDNTLVFYIWGDNGSSGEGQNGTISELLAQNMIPTTIPMHIEALDELGGLDALGSPKVDNQYHAAWAWAGSTPYKGMKLLASHLGGTRNPMAVRWPAKIAHDETPRAQFHHCNDLVPTIYEVLGITPPRVVNGVPQDPIDGVSLAYTFDDPDADGRLRTQYFEIMGSRSIYHDGWRASALGPRLPWVPSAPPGIADWTPDNDVWELYHLEEDWSQANDLAAEMPEKLAQMKEIFLVEATKNKALPIGGGLWVAALHPEQRHFTALHRVELQRRHHPDAGVHRSRAGQQAQRRDHRPGHPPGRQRRALRARRLEWWAHLLRAGRRAVLRVQPVHRAAHQDPRREQATHRTVEDRGTDAVHRPQTGWPAGDHVDGQRRQHRQGQRPSQRAADVHRERLPRHWHLPGLPRVSGLLRQSPVPLQRHHRTRARRLHVLSQAPHRKSVQQGLTSRRTSRPREHRQFATDGCGTQPDRPAPLLVSSAYLLPVRLVGGLARWPGAGQVRCLTLTGLNVRMRRYGRPSQAPFPIVWTGLATGASAADTSQGQRPM
jgi:arylsulfatase A-like enzyme